VSIVRSGNDVATVNPGRPIKQVPQTAIGPKKLDSLGLSHSKLNERYMSMERIQETEKDTDSEDDDDDDVVRERERERE